EAERALAVEVERGEGEIEGVVLPACECGGGEGECVVAEVGGCDADVEWSVGEELLGVEGMDGAAVDAVPDGAVTIGEEGALVGVVGEDTIGAGEEAPAFAIVDVDADVGSDPEPAACVEPDDLSVGGDEVGCGGGVDDGGAVTVDAEVEQGLESSADPE